MAARVPMPPAPSRRAGILVRLWPQPVRALGPVRVSGRTIVGVALRPPAAGTRVAVVGPVRLLGRLGPVTRCGLTYAATVEPDPEPVPVSAGLPPGTARVRRRRPAAATPPAPPPDGDGFAEGMALYAAGDYAGAEARFLAEAQAQESRYPQRAALAYRQAALAAARRGSADRFDHWMRLAGREYLHASEDPAAPASQVREAALAAARCFLEVENLDLSTKSLSRAKEVDLLLTEPVFPVGPETPPPGDPAAAPVPPRTGRPRPRQERL